MSSRPIIMRKLSKPSWAFAAGDYTEFDGADDLANHLYDLSEGIIGDTTR